MRGKVKVNHAAISRFRSRADKRARDLETDKDAVVGIFGAAASAKHRGSIDGQSNADIASVHEFGLGVPERSFIRQPFDASRGSLKSTMSRAAKTAARTKRPVEWALAVVGQQFKDTIIETINSRIPPPLSPRTVARKGSSVPLIDTGQLKQSIDFEVRRK